MAKDVNLSSQEWLDIVFDGKNKDFGAYTLRANSVRRHNKAVIIVFVIIALIVVALILAVSGVFTKAEEDTTTGVDQQLAQLGDTEEMEDEDIPEEIQLEQPEVQEVPPEELVNSQAVTDIVIVDEVKNEVKDISQVMDNSSQISQQDEDRGKDDHTEVKTQVEVKVPEKAPEPVVVKETNDQVYTVASVEQKPSFPGGDTALYQYLNSHIQYPAQAAEEGVEGRVVVEFTVGKTGNIENVKVVRGKHPALDKEAMRVVKSMPAWTPARQNGQAVKCTYTLPVQFKLAK